MATGRSASPMDMNAVSDALGKARSHKGAKLHSMTLRRAKGGFIAKHDEYRHDDGEMSHDHPMRGSEHVLSDMDAVKNHVGKHFEEEAAEAKADKEKAE